MASRVLAVMAAVFLVGAVAAGTLSPPDISLGEALLNIDRMHVTAMEAALRAHMSAWVWDHAVTALLVRPVWLLPATIGIVLAGTAMTAGSLQKQPASRRRRS